VAERLALNSVVFRVPKPWEKELRALTQRTRIRRSEYLREAIADLLAHHAAENAGMMPGLSRPTGCEETALHVLAPKKHADDLRLLAARSRIPQSTLMREAVGALLLKYRSPAQGAAGVSHG